MKYNIIASGSKGNALIIQDSILIDCGVSFKKLIPYYRDIKVVFLTHIHSDHFNKTTIKKLHQERPSLRFACLEPLLEDLLKIVDVRQVDLLEAYQSFEYKSICKVRPIPLYHDVPNHGYVMYVGEYSVFYATDTKDLTDISVKNFDYYFIEGNYRERGIEERIKEKTERGEFVYEYRSMETHMSVEYALAWLSVNARIDSKFVLMHQSENS